MLSYFKKHLLFWGMFVNIALFLLLLAQNPFSSKNILSDLYPYPDTINYINPAVHIMHGYGFKISREGRLLSTDVPPLYSIVLIPFYLINHDPRVFYFTNVILAVLAFFIFYLDLRLLTKNKLILVFVQFIYLTSFFIYWYPGLAMSENLFLPLFLFGIYLLFTRISKAKIIFAAITGLSFVATKYALAPLCVSYYTLYVLKIFINSDNQSIKIRTKIYQLLLLSSTGLITYILFSYSEHMNKGVDFLIHSKSILKPMISTASKTETSDFSYSNFSDGWIQYLAALMGGSIGFAGLYLQIVPIFVGMLGLPAMFYSLIIKKLRFIGFSLIFMLFVSVLFMSTFKTVDGRYIYHAIPILLFAFTIFLSEAQKYLSQKKLKPVYFFGIALIFIYYLYTSTGQVYTQIFKNINGDKQPLNYNTVLSFNNYFKNSAIDESKKPIVISALIPYFIDFYSNGNYRILPLSQTAYFAYSTESAWGIDHTQNLYSLFDSYLKNGINVYVSDSGIYYWNTKFLLNSFNQLLDNHNFILVSTGCSNECHLFKLEIK